MNIDARSAGPPSFVRQPAIYQPNPKELQHCLSTRRLAIVPHGARSEQAGAGGVTGVGEGAEYTFFQGGEGAEYTFFQGGEDHR